MLVDVIFIVKPSQELWLTWAKETHSPHEERLDPLDVNALF